MSYDQIILGLSFLLMIVGVILLYVLRRENNRHKATIKEYNEVVGQPMSYSFGVRDVHTYVFECAKTAQANDMPEHVVNLMGSMADAIRKEFSIHFEEKR